MDQCLNKKNKDITRLVERPSKSSIKMMPFNFIKRKYTNIISDANFSEIFRGSIWALVARILATGMGLISSIIIARFYGAEIIGILAIMNSFLMIATIFTILGANISILRLMPEHLAIYSPTSAFKLYRKIKHLVIGASLIAGALFFMCANFIANKIFSNPQISFYFTLSAVIIIFKSLMILNTQTLRGLKLIRAFSIMLVMPQTFNLILLILIGFLISSKNVPVYALLGSFGLTGILSLFIIEHRLKSQMKPTDRVKPISSSEILAISLPMLMSSSLVFIIGQTGVIMLGMFGNEAEVGYYAIAMKLALLTTFILQAINSMAAPKFSELFSSGDIEKLFYIAKKSAKLIFWTTSPILFGLLIFGKPLISILFGDDFSVAYPALVVLVLGQFVNSISGATGLFMNMTGNQSVFRNILFVAALLNIGLNLLLIPEMGFHGAAVSSMISIVFWNVITLAYMKFKFGKTTSCFYNIIKR